MSDGTTFSEVAWTLDIGSWTRATCIGVCLVSIFFGAQTLARYRRYFNDDSPAIELPTMFLLPWLGACDILFAASNLVQLLQSGNNAGWALTESSMDLVRRTALASQICYFLVHIMLAIHVMSVAGVLNPNFDRSIGGYYGPAAGALSFVITHRVLAAAPLYSAFYYTLLPTATLAAVFAAALLVPNADCAKDARITVFIGEDEDVEATVSLGDYSVFSKTVAAMCLVWHLPWLLWCHTPKPAGWALMLAFVPLCARGIHSFALLRMSPATGVQVLDDDDDDSSNGGNNDKHSH
ncbi:hypothetical protein IWW39_001176 [Coemansia spiralis]|uniref:Uncharacterized protein n=1 Tax=Coemansia spiralis TaxID=417178 RepID=A0A9W8GNL7_9FUNG|nr:hypothetical protein IWW39_001176 [Coemansia spiralis]